MDEGFDTESRSWDDEFQMNELRKRSEEGAVDRRTGDPIAWNDGPSFILFGDDAEPLEDVG